MSSDVELYKYNWDRLILDLRGLGTGDRYTLEKILLAFGEKCGNRYYLLNNEFWEEYNSFYAIIEVISDHFHIRNDKVCNVIFDNRRFLNMCRGAAEVQEELGL
jgi:hypothetical protein